MPGSFIGRVGFILQRYGLSYIRGAGVTMVIALVGTLIGCIIGFIVGIIQTIPQSREDSLLKTLVLGAIKDAAILYRFLWARVLLRRQADL